ncbi:MAG: hypothetical protein NZ554_10400 [Bryobacteraceae bacterium]|nr:hypothetical protein [Bryobacteraceae bacterium]
MPSEDVRAAAWAAPGIAYAGTANGLARYAGGRWSRVEPLTGRVDAVAARSGELFVVHQGMLWRLSGDGAEKIAPLPPGAAVRSLAAGAGVLVGTDQGLWEMAGGRLRRDVRLDRLLAANREVPQVAVSEDGYCLPELPN